MGQVLRIEDDETVALASELAAMKGMTLASAVTHALRAGIEKERLRQEWVAKMVGATDRFAARLGELPAETGHDWLYDNEMGLPA